MRFLLRHPNLARFRVNAFVQQRGAGAVFRIIPSTVLSLEELKAPEDLPGDLRISRAAWCW